MAARRRPAELVEGDCPDCPECRVLTAVASLETDPWGVMVHVHVVLGLWSALPTRAAGGSSSVAISSSVKTPKLSHGPGNVMFGKADIVSDTTDDAVCCITFE